MKKKTVIGIVAALLLALSGVLLMFHLIRKSSYEKQELLEYSTHSGGGMNGGSSGTTLSAYGDRALLTYSHTDWYYEDPVVTEYLISKDALNEVKELFVTCGMYDWNGKTFSNLFVADGESTSYEFSFSDDRVWFSSQIYPARYAKKLAELDKVIEKYSVGGEKCPGLVLPEKSGEEQASVRQIPEGSIALCVYEYSQNCLQYWIGNGTEKEVPYEGKYILTDEKGNVIASNAADETYAGTLYPQSSEEESIRLESRLEAGTYTLRVDELEYSFEVR